MTASPAKAVRAAASAAALLFCVCPAASQDAPSAPVAVVPARDTAPAVPSVEVNSLGSPDGPPIGLLDPTNGGLAGDIWSGSSRSAIEALMARMPLATPVASIRTLARRILLTKADAPVGDAPHAFQTVRIEALLNAGHVEDAASLAVQAQIKDDPEFANVQGEAILLGERTIDACGNATAARLSSAEPFWMQLRAYCFAVSGQTDMLDLTRGVMKAQGSDDPAFETLLNDALNHKSVDPGEIHDPTAVDAFLIQLVGLPVSPRLAEKFGLSASVVALRDAANPPAARGAAAEDVVHSGAVSAVELGVIADQQTFSSAQLAAAATAADDLPFFAGQALVRQAAAHQANMAAKASLLHGALERGERQGLLPIAAGLQAAGIATLKPEPAMRAYAGLFAKALLLAGNPDVAERWRESLDPNLDGDRPLAAELAVDLNLKAPNAGRNLRAQQALSWFAQNATSLQPLGGPEAQRFGALAVGLYAALDEPMPQDAKALVATLARNEWPGRKIAPSVFKRLSEARDQPGLAGEALLTIIDAVGAGGPGDLAPNATIALVRALKAEGVSDAARAFAADALLLYYYQLPESFRILPPAPAAQP